MPKSLHLTHTNIESDSRILKEMTGLAKAGYEVVGIGIALHDGSRKSALPLRADVSIVRLQCRSLTVLPRLLRHVASFCEMIIKIVPRAVRERADVIHCHDTPALLLGMVVKTFTQARLIYDAHELESDRNGLTRFQSCLTLLVERIIWRFVDALIVVSPSIEAWYQQNIGRKRAVVILNSPVFCKKVRYESDYLRLFFSIPSDRTIFIYVGILGPGRGIDLITSAFSDPSITSHVVFLGYGSLAGKIKQLAAIHANIHFHEPVPHSDVVSIVRSANFGLCMIEEASLSDYFCLPNKLFEYCFAGVPVLASNFPDISRILLEYGIGECCNHDLHKFMLAIKRLDVGDKYFHFQDLSPLSWQAQEGKLLDLYKQLLLTKI